MRLLVVASLGFAEYADERQAPRYGILSHRWGDEEVSYQDMLTGTGSQRKGYAKLAEFCRQCTLGGLSHGWVDTCCIDKNSSAELSEAINSMYRWYKNASKCYAFLADMDDVSKIADSVWFERGWTLQELIAPDEVQFYDKNWRSLGSKRQLSSDIEAITKIPQDVLYGDVPMNYSIAQRMSWASRRKTTRIEDQAYSLMGLFNVNMPMLYGEGDKAFIRLQEEIIKYSADQSIFAWPGIISDYDKSELYDVTHRNLQGLLATSPAAFQLCGEIRWQQDSHEQHPFSITNLGLSIDLLLRPVRVEIYEAKLNCFIGSDYISIFVRETDRDGQYVRHDYNGSLSRIWRENEDLSEGITRINIVQGHDSDSSTICLPILKLAPGPLFKHTSDSRSLVQITSTRSFTMNDGMIPIRPGAYGAVVVLQTKKRLEGVGNICLEFGFDSHFDPYLYLWFDDTDLARGSVRRGDVVPCKTSIWDPVIQRQVSFQQVELEPNLGWMFKAHRSQGLFVWLKGLNTVVDLRKRTLLSQKFWMVDIQKAHPQNINLLSIDGYRQSKAILDESDIRHERLTEEDVCIICAKFLDVPIKTSCGHEFCQRCFDWANISIATSHLVFRSSEESDDSSVMILCPICGRESESCLDSKRQYKIQNHHPYNWRLAMWRSPGDDVSKRFPVLIPLHLVIGNTHKYTEGIIGDSGRLNRHDWTFYIRPACPELIANIRVRLHSTFRNNLLYLSSPPFEVRHFGWGIFDVRADITLKEQYRFLNEEAVTTADGKSSLRVWWTLSFARDDTQAWLKLMVKRFKSQISDHDDELLAQYAKLQRSQARASRQEIASSQVNARSNTPTEDDWD